MDAAGVWSRGVLTRVGLHINPDTPNKSKIQKPIKTHQQHRRHQVLALDELFVTDVADAMILARLFGRLWDAGLTLVATSNRAPDKLYEGGLQRDLFLPFIKRLKEACVDHDMCSPVDYRRLARHARGLYFLSPERDEELYEAFLEAGAASSGGALVGGDSGGVSGDSGSGGGGGGGGIDAAPAPVDVQVAMGRVLRVPDALGERFE